MAVNDLTAIVLETKADGTCTVPAVVHVPHLDATQVQVIQAGTCAVATVNIPVRLAKLGVYGLGMVTVDAAYAAELRIDLQTSITLDALYIITHTTYDDQVTGCVLLAESGAGTCDSGRVLVDCD